MVNWLTRWWHRERPQDPYVTVLETGDRGAVAIARSLLDSAGMKYWVRDDLIQDFFGIGRIGPCWNHVLGPMRIVVNREDAETATEILPEIGRSRPRLWVVIKVYAILWLATWIIGLVHTLANTWAMAPVK